jgi:hypothetical protein
MDRGGYFYFDKKYIIILAVLFCVGVGVLFVMLGYKTCDDWNCFNERLESCSRTRFIGGSEMIFEYSIRGFRKGSCEVGVELLQGELNNQDSIKLEGEKMSCYLPRGVVMIPESDIGNCHGLLKEGLQELVIQKLQTYLVQNLGRINLELINVEDLVPKEAL